jgi:hypothetical protein
LFSRYAVRYPSFTEKDITPLLKRKNLIHKEVTPVSYQLANGCVGNCTRFSTSRLLKACFY